MISVVNCGIGNIRSVLKAFKRLKVRVQTVSTPSDLSKAKKILLPGVGHFSRAMNRLGKTGFASAIKENVLVKKTPILGICLGMQLMTRYSAEGEVEGLQLVNAETIKLSSDNGIKIPHMGWNVIKPEKKSYLYDEIDPQSQFYFVHSYYVKCNNPEDKLFTTVYGIDFDSGFQRKHILGVQFHPEKSHEAGLQLLNNFAKM
jgi:glutamine amidotransferase